uniref:Uncharacterized protein n=1 Tax=Babesia orientalis TaxID=273649 RepID=A0A0M4N386_9APIC|nr:hypothetical protein [Babesia orientalis]ALE29352.1 hypothetical protein [Babesia orientalis]
MIKDLELLLDLLDLIKLFISMQFEALLYLIIFIILTIKDYVLSLFKKKETKLEKIINFLKNNKKAIIQFLCILFAPAASPLWCIVQLYTIATSLYKSQFENLINLIPFTLNYIYAQLTGNI